ncbi:hypothetical protein ACOI22_13975 [Glaciecola sp. 2405UD65-10]|jgi:hypothetical protein|uniref:hypothetical protein n=1 Tax=Glaciecola sp. 2405UD65-10 TaxID=3397244 RepID=UPI003B5C302F
MKFVVISFLLTTLSLFVSSFDARALYQEAPSVQDCSTVALDDVDPNSLTREERIAMLEGSLRQSIDEYSTCINEVSAEMAGGGNGGYEGGGAGSSAGDGAQASTGNTSESSESATSNSQSNSEHAIQVNSTPVNAGVIPPKDNDKIICKLLFQEINSTQDTAMLEGLKEQYRNYKCGA